MKNRINLLRFDQFALSKHISLDNNDECYHWREYTPGEGYDYSDTNQLIHNFKIGVTEEVDRLYYKNNAIKTIAKEFIDVIKKDETYKNFTFVPIPPSKSSSHLEYDDRILKVLYEVAHLKKITMDIRQIIEQKSNTDPAHASSIRLSIDELYEIYKVNIDLIEPRPKKIFIFDDVLTKGTHFKAMQRTLNEIWTNVPIVGLFIARSIYPQH